MPVNGEPTRQRILGRAADVASVRGLHSLTIGGLAADVGVSKGAVANHFPTKHELQLSTIEAAATVVEQRIAGDARTAEPGLPRLRALLDGWLDYLDDPPFAGGCFFCTTTMESGLDVGEVRDTLAFAARLGLDLLTEQTRLAQRLGELDDDAPAEQVVFELHAYLQEANWSRRLFDDDDAINRARHAIDARLRREDNQ